MPCNTTLGGSYTPLHLACSYGHIDIVERILKRGADIEVKTLEGRSCLHVAICHFEEDTDVLLKLVELLLDNGAKIDTVDQDNVTILHTAVDKLCLPLVELIVQRILSSNISLKPFINSQSVSGLTPLHIAAAKGSLEIAEFLLKHGAAIDIKETNNTVMLEEGFTPLHVASKHIHVEMIKLLLANGADVNATSVNDSTPAHVVLSFPDNFCHRNLQRGLLALGVLMDNGVNINKADKNGESLLNLGVKLRCLPVVQLILSYKPDKTNYDNKTALRTAVITGTKFSDEVFCDFSFNLRVGAVKENRSIIEELFSYGLVLNDSDIQNGEVLHHAIRKGYLNVVQYLLNHGADFMALSALGTPLHSAVSMLQEDMVKLLVELGANVNVKDMTGKSPFFYITEKLEKLKTFRDFGDSQKCFNVARELLLNGANLMNDSKFLVIAARRRSKELVEMALKCNADVKVIGQNGCTALHAAVLADDEYLVEMLLEHGAVIDAEDNEYKTPLLIAISQQKENITNHLLDKGAAVNVRDNSYYSPLHYAAIWGNSAITERLLSLGAHIDPRTNKNTTPLHLAAELGCGKAVLSLLRGGADAKAKRSDDVSSLHLASKWANEAVVENLLYYGADPQARTATNLTPLGYSLQECHPGVVRILLENGGYTQDMCCRMCQSYRWFEKHSRPECSEMYEILHLHFLDLEAQNMWPLEDLCYCRLWFKTDVIRGNVTEEIENLKSKAIVKGVNLYDIICKPKSQLVSLARNETIIESLKNVDLPKEFPVFAKLLQYRWGSAVIREKLLSSGSASFNALLVESIVNLVDNSLDLKENLSKYGYCWLLDYLKISNKNGDHFKSTSKHFVEYLRGIHSLLPTTVVEKIINHLSDNDLRHLVSIES